MTFEIYSRTAAFPEIPKVAANTMLDQVALTACQPRTYVIAEGPRDAMNHNIYRPTILSAAVILCEKSHFKQLVRNFRISNT